MQKKLPVAFFSLETGGKVIYERMACAHSQIERFRISEDILTKEEWKNFALKIGELIKAPLFIFDKPALYIKDIKNNIEELIKQGKKPELIVIDYFDLIKQENEQAAVANMRALKELAVKFDVPFLVCSQMYRKKEGEPNRPELSQLRYPQFTDIADLILLLHWEYYYTHDYKYKYLAEILIKKPFQKVIEISWLPNYCTFYNKIDIKRIKERHDKYEGRGKYRRQKYNLEILEEVKNFLEKQPDMRFIQALWALNIVDKEDRFYEEPEITLAKVKESKVQK